MKVTIHQPEHMPWLGFFHKINMADVFVILDNVKFKKLYFENRNKLRTYNGWNWITVPLKKHSDNTLIKDIAIHNDLRHTKKTLNVLWQNYNKAKFFKLYWDEFEAFYSKEYNLLLELNLELIKFFLKHMGIQIEIVLASNLDVVGTKSELNFNICKAIDAKTYISGISGKEYLDLEKFQKADIEVVFQEFHHPIYRQLHEPFIPCMSVIDLLFNQGDKSLDIINGIGVPVMDKVFL